MAKSNKLGIDIIVSPILYSVDVVLDRDAHTVAVKDTDRKLSSYDVSDDDIENYNPDHYLVMFLSMFSKQEIVAGDKMVRFKHFEDDEHPEMLVFRYTLVSGLEGTDGD